MHAGFESTHAIAGVVRDEGTKAWVRWPRDVFVVPLDHCADRRTALGSELEQKAAQHCTVALMVKG